MADWFDENNYDSQWRPPGGITGYDPNTGQYFGDLGNDGSGVQAVEPPAAAAAQDWPDNPTLNRIADAFRARGITPTRDLVMQWGGNIDANYERQILQSIAGLQAQRPTAGPTTTTAPQTRGASGPGDRDGFGAAWMASGGRTVTDLKNFAAQWNASHPDSPVTIGGSKGDKVYGPGGTFWADAVIAAGEGGGRGASWQTETGGSGGSGGGTGGISPGEFMTPWTEKFKAPTLEEMQANPAFQARLSTALRGMQASAANRGTLLTGGFQKALARENQQIASDEFDKLYNRAQGEYAQNYNIFENNQAKRYNRLASISGVGQVAANNLGAARTNYGNSQSSLYGEVGNVNAAGTAAGSNNLNNALNRLSDLFNRRTA